MNPLNTLASMPARRRLTTLAAVALAAAAATGCGSSKELPRDIPSPSADGLVTSLNDVFVACHRGDRAAAESAAQTYAQALAALPGTVNPDVRKVLTQTSDNLTALAQDPSQCVNEPSGASGAQGVTPSTSTSTETTTTPPSTTTATTPTDTTPTNTTPPANTPGNGKPGGSKPSSGNGGGSGGVGAGKANKSKHSKGHR